MSDGPAPRRVRVTSPRTGATRRRRVAGTSEIDAQTELGEVYMRSLVRAQLRLALGVTAGVAATLGLLPVVLTLLPAVRDVRVGWVPLPWLLLGLLAYPLLVGLGWVYVRRAERNEQVFSELVDRR
jgi:hypothetical protein